MAQYMIAIAHGPGDWEPIAYPGSPKVFAATWRELNRDGGHYQGFEMVSRPGGAWQYNEETNRMAPTEAWVMLSTDKHYQLEEGLHP